MVRIEEMRMDEKNPLFRHGIRMVENTNRFFSGATQKRACVNAKSLSAHAYSLRPKSRESKLDLKSHLTTIL